MVGTTLRQYEIQKEIGKGGMGVVYLAKHVSLPKLFAIKRLSPELGRVQEFRERFLEEANNQAQLDHPNIVQVTDLFEEDGHFYFVMDYVEGKDLDDRIRKLGKLEELEALKLLRGLLEALQFAHDKNIVHRDIKPSNILITKDGRPRITDFGIAILLGGRRFTSTPGRANGTPWYMSPEQIQTPHNIDHRSDIYSVGIVLYEMLTGEVPFGNHDESEFNVKEQQIKAPLPDPQQKNPNISSGVVKMIRKAMEKNPANRYQSCNEFLLDLDAKTAPRISASVFPFKTSISVVSAIGIIAGFVFFYFSSEISPQSDSRQAHDSAFILIQGATEQATIVCTKLKELPLKQSNLDIAQENGFFDLIDGYKSQIQDIKKTISDSNLKFSEAVSKLKMLDSEVVGKEFDDFVAYLDKVGHLSQAPQARLTEKFYNNGVKGSEITLEMCVKD